MEIERGSRGQFDVLLDGELVATKAPVGFFARLLGDKGFPDEERVVEELRGRVG